jgi:thiol-disulfide isomerase/thioredoxin
MKSIILLVLASLVGWVSPSFAKTPGEVEVGSILQDVQMNGLSVPPKKLSAYRGKPLIINVWASWCGPCRQEMSSLDKLARRYGGGQFNLIGISTDDNIEAAYVFLERTGTSFDNFIDKKLVLENMLGADRLPLTVLIDAQGRVLSKHYGARDWDGMEAKQLIEQAFRIRM